MTAGAGLLQSRDVVPDRPMNLSALKIACLRQLIDALLSFFVGFLAKPPPGGARVDGY